MADFLFLMDSHDEDFCWKSSLGSTRSSILIRTARVARLRLKRIQSRVFKFIRGFQPSFLVQNFGQKMSFVVEMSDWKITIILCKIFYVILVFVMWVLISSLIESNILFTTLNMIQDLIQMVFYNKHW